MNLFRKGYFAAPEGELLFDRKDLVRIVVPLMAEQVLTVTVGVADTMMVSGAGEAAISGISLVNQIAVLLILLFSALASGGTVVAAQYLGKRDFDNAQSAARHLIISCFSVSVLCGAIGLIGNRAMLSLVFGDVETDVMDAAVLYFTITAVSFPFLALSSAASSLFRAMGNTRLALTASVIMNVVNVGGNAVLIYGFGMGVAGAAYATLASRVVSAVLLMILLHDRRWDAHCVGLFTCRLHGFMFRQILKIGIPMALENSMFNIGKLLTTSLISSFGTASIAANACASNMEQICYIPGSAMGMALVTIIGQCVGADDFRQAKYYSRKMVLYTYFFIWIVNFAMLIFAPNIVSMYNLSAEGFEKGVILIRHYCCCCVVFWPLAFTLPNILRAAGDARYTLISSATAMWVCRVVAAYLIAPWMEARWGMGVWGVWIAMTMDWVVRGVLYIIRLSGTRWMKKSLVKN